MVSLGRLKSGRRLGWGRKRKTRGSPQARRLKESPKASNGLRKRNPKERKTEEKGQRRYGKMAERSALEEVGPNKQSPEEQESKDKRGGGD